MAKKHQHPAPSHQLPGEAGPDTDDQQPQIVQKVVPVEQAPQEQEVPEQQQSLDFATLKAQVAQKHVDLATYLTTLSIYVYTIGLAVKVYNSETVQKILQQILAISLIHTIVTTIAPYQASAFDLVRQLVDFHYTILATFLYYPLKAYEFIFGPFQSVSQVPSQIREKSSQLLSQAKDLQLPTVEQAKDAVNSVKAKGSEVVQSAKAKGDEVAAAAKARIVDTVQPYADKVTETVTPYAEKYEVQHRWDQFKAFLADIKQFILSTVNKIALIITPSVTRPAEADKKVAAEFLRPRFVAESLKDYTTEQVHIAAKTAYSTAKRLVSRNHPPTETVA